MSADCEVVLRPRRAFEGFLRSEKRWSCLVVHRRGGKTFSSLQKLLYRALTFRREGPPTRYAYIAPTLGQAKDIAWAYLKQFTAGIPNLAVNESELKLTFGDGMVIRLYSGENYERMRGVYFDGVILDEPEDIPPAAWNQVIRPCLSDYGGWAIWIGTIKGKHGQWKRYCEAVSGERREDWFAMILRASESGILSEEELEDIRRTTDEDSYRQEYECDPNIGRRGAIYARALSEAEAGGRVCEFGVDGSNLVHTCWDLGSPENTSVVYWQRVGLTYQVIDCDVGLSLTTLERVAHMLAKGYRYGAHCLPHDAAAVHAGGMSFQEELAAAGLVNTAIIPRTQDVERRINGMLERFGRLYIHKTRCEALLQALEHYHRKEDVKGGFITDRIVHDWASHPCDAFGYIAEAEAAGLVDGIGAARRRLVAPRVSGLGGVGGGRKTILVDEDEW